MASTCNESVPASPCSGHEGGILAERLALLPHPHPWPCLHRPRWAAIALELEGSLPWISCLPLQSLPRGGRIFFPSRGYSPSHHAACTGLCCIWGRASPRCSSLPLCLLLAALCCVFQVFTDGVTPWSISSHCSALCLIRELNGLDRIKAFAW